MPALAAYERAVKALQQRHYTKAAATHLLRAIDLNADNRFLARNEPSFHRLRDDDAVQKALESPAAAPRTVNSPTTR